MVLWTVGIFSLLVCYVYWSDVLFVITPHCRDVIKELLILDGHVAKDKFVNAYIEVINSQ